MGNRKFSIEYIFKFANDHHPFPGQDRIASCDPRVKRVVPEIEQENYTSNYRFNCTLSIIKLIFITFASINISIHLHVRTILQIL